MPSWLLQGAARVSSGLSIILRSLLIGRVHRQVRTRHRGASAAVWWTPSSRPYEGLKLQSLPPKALPSGRATCRTAPEALDATPRTPFEDCGIGRNLKARAPCSKPRQAFDQVPHHLLIPGFAMQGHGQDVIHQDARREHPLTLFSTADPCNDVIHQERGEGVGQQPDRDRSVRRALSSGLRQPILGTA